MQQCELDRNEHWISEYQRRLVPTQRASGHCSGDPSAGYLHREIMHHPARSSRISKP